MGLFDPPTKKLMKLAPVSAQPHLAAVQIFAEDALPASIGQTKVALVAAIVMGSWISMNAQAGSFDMSRRDLDNVIQLCNNCTSFAGPESRLARPIILALCDRGFFPEGVADYLRALPKPTAS